MLALATLLPACHRASSEEDAAAERGRALVARYGCGYCHEIPGVRGADGTMGPSLARIGSRVYIAGRLPNTTDHLARWILEPQLVKPTTAMPNVHATGPDAHDMAAYLERLR